MRGLELRMKLARLRVHSLIAEGKVDTDVERYLMAEVVNQGRLDCYAGLDEPPSLIQSEPVLLKYWHEGYDLADEALDFSACAECNDGTGNPCPSHG